MLTVYLAALRYTLRPGVKFKLNTFTLREYISGNQEMLTRLE